MGDELKNAIGTRFACNGVEKLVEIGNYVQDLWFAGLGKKGVPRECRNRLTVRRLPPGVVAEWQN